MTLLQTSVPLEKFYVPVGIILVTLVIGLWIVSKLKKRLQDEDDPGDLSAGFTLSDLREMVRRGEMSQAEFDKAKQKVIAAARKETEPPDDGSGSAPDGSLQ